MAETNRYRRHLMKPLYFLGIEFTPFMQGDNAYTLDNENQDKNLVLLTGVNGVDVYNNSYKSRYGFSIKSVAVLKKTATSIIIPSYHSYNPSTIESKHFLYVDGELWGVYNSGDSVSDLPSDSPKFLISYSNFAISYIKRKDIEYTVSSGFVYATDSSIKNHYFYNPPSSLSQYYFRYCTQLTGTMVIPEGVKSIEEGGVSDCYSITKLVIPESIKYIDSNSAFGNFHNLNSVEINSNAYYEYTRKTFKVKKENFIIGENVTDYEISSDGILYYNYPNKDESIPLNFIPGFADDFVIKRNAKIIPSYAGYDGRYDKNLYIHSGIKSIGNYAFFRGGVNIYFEDTALNGLTVGEETFRHCLIYKTQPKYTDLILPEGATSLGIVSFANNDYTGKLYVPNSITYLYPGRNHPFAGNSFTELELHSNVRCNYNFNLKYGKIILGSEITDYYISEDGQGFYYYKNGDKSLLQYMHAPNAIDFTIEGATEILPHFQGNKYITGKLTFAEGCTNNGSNTKFLQLNCSELSLPSTFKNIFYDSRWPVFGSNYKKLYLHWTGSQIMTYISGWGMARVNVELHIPQGEKQNYIDKGWLESMFSSIVDDL